MKTYTPEELKQIQELAALFFTEAEIAEIMGLEVDDLIDYNSDIQTEATIAINTGRMQSEAEVRKSIFDLAKNGSAPAQTLAVKFMEQYHLRKI